MGHFARKRLGDAALLVLRYWISAAEYGDVGHLLVYARAYLHCAVKPSAVTTACLLTLALKCIFAGSAVWLRRVMDIFWGKGALKINRFYMLGLSSFLTSFWTVNYIESKMYSLMSWISLFGLNFRHKRGFTHQYQYAVFSKRHTAYPSLSPQWCIHQEWKLKLLSKGAGMQYTHTHTQSDKLAVQSQTHCLRRRKTLIFGSNAVCFVAVASIVLSIHSALGSSWFLTVVDLIRGEKKKKQQEKCCCSLND